jgi:hypothetical protein
MRTERWWVNRPTFRRLRTHGKKTLSTGIFKTFISKQSTVPQITPGITVSSSEPRRHIHSKKKEEEEEEDTVSS